MKKIAAALTIIAFSSIVNANDLPSERALDIVDFQLSAKRWVSTQTALLTVNLDATLGNADLVKARADIMTKLAKIAVGEWHLTQFDRSQDASGLEKLNAQAQARVSQSSLTLVYQNAKTVSKPGESYQINTIEFKPSQEEIQHVRIRLREELYQQVQDELTRINHIYSEQHFTLNNLFFSEGVDANQPKPAYQSRTMMSPMATETTLPTLSVSNELIMTAVVQVASNRQREN